MSAAFTRRAGRVLIAKVGLDGHEAGAKLVCRILRDNGFEVIYTGIRSSVAGVVHTAIAEDVDVIGISLLSGTHLAVADSLRAQLGGRGEEIPVVFGGVIPPDDVPRLLEKGVRAVLGPGSYASEIVDAFARNSGHSPAQVPSQGSAS